MLPVRSFTNKGSVPIPVQLEPEVLVMSIWELRQPLYQLTVTVPSAGIVVPVLVTVAPFAF